MADTWEMIDNRVRVMQGFYRKLDKVRDRLNLTPYKMTDYDGKTPLDDVVIVTENKAAAYMDRIVSTLMSAKPQTQVRGEINPRDAHRIEKFIEYTVEQTNEYLLNKYGMAELNTWLCNHVCHTSLIGVHWMSYMENKEYKIHCCPVDMRWTPYVLNKWVAPITFRSKDDLLEELEEYQKAALDGRGEFFTPAELKDTNNEVRDLWDVKKNELWIEKQLVYRCEHSYSTPPFVIVKVSSGWMFRDRDYDDMPSIIALNMGLYDQISRQLSIDATLGFEPVLPSYEYETDNPSGDVSRPVPRRGETLEVPTGELHKPVPRGDVNRASLTSRDEVNRMVDEAAPMAPRAYNQPPSAVEVATEVELLQQIQNPELIALKVTWEQIYRKAIEHFNLASEDFKGAVSIGKMGKQAQYTRADMKDITKYYINVELFPKSTRLDIVNEARALAMWGRFPTKYILRDVLSVEDPDGWMREMQMEEARKADPALSLFEMAVRYAEEAEDMEDEAARELKNFQSMMLVDRGVAMVKQRLQPTTLPQEAQTPMPKEVTGNAQGLISLLGQRQGAPAQPKGVTGGLKME